MTAQKETVENTPEQTADEKKLPVGLDTIENAPIAVYDGDTLKKIITLIEKQAKSEVPDPTTEKGRTEIKALARKVARSKTHLDALGKKIVEPLKAQAKETDAKRRMVRDRLDALKSDLLAPIEQFQAAQMKRVDDLQAKVDRIKKLSSDRDDFGIFLSVEQLREKLNLVNAIEIDDSYAEFSNQAKLAKHDTQAMIQIHIKNAEDRESQEAARREQDRKEQLERDEKIRKEAAEQERTRIKEEQQRKEKAEAEEKRRQEDSDRLRRQNVAYRQTRRNQAAAELQTMLNVAHFDPAEKALAIVEAIEAGRIPHVSISF